MEFPLKNCRVAIESGGEGSQHTLAYSHSVPSQRAALAEAICPMSPQSPFAVLCVLTFYPTFSEHSLMCSYGPWEVY